MLLNENMTAFSLESRAVKMFPHLMVGITKGKVCKGNPRCSEKQGKFVSNNKAISIA